MSLRTRLVASLVVLLTLGLTVYGAGTYRTFAAAELDRLDDDLRASVPLVEREMNARLRRPTSGLGATPAVVVAPGTYAELRGPDEDVLATLQVARSEAVPDLDAYTAEQTDGVVTVASEQGDGRWRVISTPQRPGHLVVAVPMTAIEESLARLLLIEVTVGAGLLVLLGTGAWLLLRRGLRPVERIADTAATITAGQLHRRVPDDAPPHTEVARLAGAINGMLDELEAAFRARQATEARLRRFLADASHELRTPLTSIQGFAELYRLDDAERQLEVPVMMRRIEEESARMRTLVEDLLLLARLDETRPPEVGDVDLTVLAADACSDAVASAPERPVRLDAPEPVVVRADGAHLRQALGNLVTNAVRHTPAGTAIEVTAARADDGRPLLAVRDHGPGLDEAALTHAFERFWRADPARSGTGAGLGLSIVAAIAAEHGGDVEVANHPEGGAVFTLHLPAARSTDGPPPPPPPMPATKVTGPAPPPPDGQG